MLDELRKLLKKEIESTTGVSAYFRIATSKAPYPYVVFNVKELSSEEVDKHLLEVTVDAWDVDDPKRVIKTIDALDVRFKQYKAHTEDMFVQIFCGSEKGFLEDEDKNIVRLQRKYDMSVYEKGD